MKQLKVQKAIDEALFYLERDINTLSKEQLQGQLKKLLLFLRENYI